jgi:hypothetical protein
MEGRGKKREKESVETLQEQLASYLTEDAVMREESSPHMAASRAMAMVLAPQKAKRYITALHHPSPLPIFIGLFAVFKLLHCLPSNLNRVIRTKCAWSRSTLRHYHDYVSHHVAFNLISAVQQDPHHQRALQAQHTQPARGPQGTVISCPS